jgi:hypothetical protein
MPLGILDHLIPKWWTSFFFFVVLEFALRASTLRNSTSPLFVLDFFEIGSQKLFAWAGFEL